MKLEEELSSKNYWKYDLRDEALAAAASGMTNFTDLDKRCITFTIHLTDPTGHEALCRELFKIMEEFFTKLLGKTAKVSHTGLASFLDVNGSKFSGADRDQHRSHCHGCIFIPHAILESDVATAIEILRDTALAFEGVKTGPEAVQVIFFKRNCSTASLVDWLGYAQKEATRRETVGTFGFFLPFDIRASYGGRIAQQVESRRDRILHTLSGPDRFKVYRSYQSPPRLI